MPIAPIAAAAAPIVGGLIGKAVGPKSPTTTPQLPNDLTGDRADTLGIMRYLLGTGMQNPTAGANAPPFQKFGGTTQSPLGGINGPSPQGMNAGAVNFGDNPLSGMMGTQPRTGGMPQLMPQAPGGEGFSAPLSPQGGRVQSVFGQTGVQATPLQRQSTGGISQFLNQPSPELRAMEGLAPGLMQMFSGGVQGSQGGAGGNILPPEVLANLTRMASGQQAGMATSGSGVGGMGAEGADFLRGVLKQQPGQGTIDALNPSFQRNLAEANQSGGRFGTANAVMRSRAMEDFNLLAAQAAQQGQAQQLDAASRLAQMGINSGAANAGFQNSFNQNQQAAVDALIRSGLGGGQLAQSGALGAGGLLGQLAGQSGQNDFQRLVQGYGVGSQQAGQNDVETQRNLGILMNMFGGMQQATLGAPTQTTPNGFSQGAGLGGSIGALIALLGKGNQQPGGSGTPNNLG